MLRRITQFLVCRCRRRVQNRAVATRIILVDDYLIRRYRSGSDTAHSKLAPVLINRYNVSALFNGPISASVVLTAMITPAVLISAAGR